MCWEHSTKSLIQFTGWEWLEMWIIVGEWNIVKFLSLYSQFSHMIFPFCEDWINKEIKPKVQNRWTKKKKKKNPLI